MLYILTSSPHCDTHKVYGAIIGPEGFEFEKKVQEWLERQLGPEPPAPKRHTKWVESPYMKWHDKVKALDFADFCKEHGLKFLRHEEVNIYPLDQCTVPE